MDSGVLIVNERYKAISSALFNLATGLLAAAVVRMYVDRGIGFETFGWLFTSGVLMWVGWKVLGFSKRRVDVLVFPAVVVDMIPAIVGLTVAAGGWGLALYTKARAHPRSDRDRMPRQ